MNNSSQEKDAEIRRLVGGIVKKLDQYKEQHPPQESTSTPQETLKAAQDFLDKKAKYPTSKDVNQYGGLVLLNTDENRRSEGFLNALANTQGASSEPNHILRYKTMW